MRFVITFKVNPKYETQPSFSIQFFLPSSKVYFEMKEKGDCDDDVL